MSDTAATPLLECRGVEVAYRAVQVLFGVDLNIREGEIVALLGTNGAGKSTLLRAISGLVDPIGGSIEFAGMDITHAGPVRTAKLGIVHVPGGKAVFPTLTVAEHFRLGKWNLRRSEAQCAEERTMRVLQLFPRLRERWAQLAGSLSGGEAQQLALGMAFVNRPRLLVIDELSLGLAPVIVEELLRVVRDMNQEGATVLLVEQSVNLALELAGRAYFMEKGEVRFSGPTAELLERDDILRAVFLEGASTLARAPAAGGSPAPTPAAEDGSPPRRNVLEVHSLTKHFGGVRAVEDVSFDLRAGEILGLIGPNGAGKTSVFDLLSGLLVPDAGSVRMNGVNITRWSAPRRSAFGLGRSFQDVRLFPSLSVAENIALGLERHIATRDHLAALLCLPAAQDAEADVDFTVERLIEMLNLEAYRDKFVSELSTGSRRVVELAMTIAHRPSVLILDEPSSGIAQREVEALAPLLLRIREETGCSMLVIEHDMPLVTAVSDEILALDTGRVVMRGRPHEVTSDPRVVASYLGRREVTAQIPVVGIDEPTCEIEVAAGEGVRS